MKTNITGMTRMKNIIVACCTVMGFLQVSYAQKVVNEASLIYNISIVSLNEKGNTAKPLDGATLNLYVRKTDSMSDMISSLGKESNLFDAKTGNGFILKGYSGQKLMITLTRENWKQKNQYFSNLKFSIDNTEHSMAGYTCRKATAKTEEGKDFIVYFLPDFTFANKEYNNAFAQIPGIPVYYELESGKLKFTYTLTGISYDNISPNKFEVPKTGFRVMTYDENQQLKKG